MWPQTFADRLISWNALRQQCNCLPVDQALVTINTWWFACPWRPYHLHWDDQADWPDPWQLLDDNIYCGLARALGIMYTVVLLDRTDMPPGDIVEVNGDNLVLFDQGKYILNWQRDTVVNINLALEPVRRRLSQQNITKKIK